jgi:hypothetical protein
LTDILLLDFFKLGVSNVFLYSCCINMRDLRLGRKFLIIKSYWHNAINIHWRISEVTTSVVNFKYTPKWISPKVYYSASGVVKNFGIFICVCLTNLCFKISRWLFTQTFAAEHHKICSCVAMKHWHPNADKLKISNRITKLIRSVTLAYLYPSYQPQNCVVHETLKNSFL